MPCSDSFQVVIARVGLCLCFLFGLSQSAAGQSPTLTSIKPDRTPVGQIPAKVVLKGTGFETSSVVVINTTPVAASIKPSGKKIVIKDLPTEFFQTSGVLEIKVIPATGLESNSIRLTVGSLNTIQLDASTELVVNVGTTVTLRAQVLDAQGVPLPDAVITYSSLTPDQATVDQAGVVTGIQTGAATIRLTSGEAIRDLVVTVTDVASIPSGIVGDGDIKVDSQNRVYATDLRRHIIRSAPVGQPLAEFAGAVDLPGNIDGALTSSRFNGPLGLGLGSNSPFVYLADTANQSIRRFNRETGTVETVVGLADVAAVASVDSWGPRGVVEAQPGELYVTDADNHVVWKVRLGTTPDVSVFAGTVGQPGLLDGTGNNALFNAPQDLVSGTQQSILVVTDRGNRLVRLIALPDGQVTTVGNIASARVLTRTNTYVPKQSVTFGDPQGVEIDSIGNLYVTDGNTVRVVELQDTTFVVSDLAQSGTFQNATGISLASGSAYVLDSGKQQVIRVALGAPPSISELNINEIKAGQTTELTINGSNFIPNTQVKIGSQFVYAVRVENASRIRCLLPPQPESGPLQITVQHRGGSATTTVNVVSAPFFQLALEPSERSVTAGQMVEYKVRILRTNFNGNVALSLSGLPAGTQARFLPNVTSAGESTLTIATAATVEPGKYPIRVSGLTTGVTATTDGLLVVTRPEPGSVSIAVNPSTKTIAPGQNATFQIALNRSNFVGPVKLLAEGVPAGARADFAPSELTGNSSNLTLTTLTSVAEGTYRITIKGLADNTPVQASALTLTIQKAATGSGVRIVATPASLTINAGQSATYNLELQRTSFTGDVRLSVSGLPSGAVASFRPESTTGTTSQLIVTTAASTPTGTVRLTISGSASGTSVTPTSVTLAINSSSGGGASVRFSVSPETRTIQAGQTASFAVNLLRTSFTGEVRFALLGLPAGAQASFNPDRTTGNSTTLTVVTAASLTPGSYVLTVSGTAFGATISPAAATLVVSGNGGGNGSVSLSANPVSQTVQAGNTAQYSIRLTRTSFDGEVKFGIGTLPAGVTARFDPDRTTGNSSQLTLQVGGTVAGGTYQIPVSGLASGATVTGTMLTLIVNAAPQASVTISVSPSSSTIRLGGSASFSINLARMNYTGAVSLSVAGLPAGITAVFNPESTLGNSAGLTLSARTDAPIGTYTIRINGATTGGVTINQATITVTTQR
ncbi:MAG TPA: IPT/TIG domain-containing protein [Acidobacteriota bacterium]|nr:IPT/TIG domain-containing protein [Acidobacteriota bacterium]